MEKGFKVIYEPHLNSAERGYTFDIILEENVSIRGEHFESREDRDNTAKRICKELGLIMTME